MNFDSITQLIINKNNTRLFPSPLTFSGYENDI